MPLCPEEELSNIEHSGKFMLLFAILAECKACGEKLLVFSQSLSSLDVIEHFLKMIDENTQNPNPNAKLGGFTGNWKRGVDYFRLDGSTNINTRNANCNKFNSEVNSQARFVIKLLEKIIIASICEYNCLILLFIIRLFLISTLQGLGINLEAANRVIIFDASQNHSDDVRTQQF